MLAFALLCGGPLFSESLRLKDSIHSKNITSNLEFLESDRGDFSPLSNGDLFDWKRIGFSSLNFSFSDKSYWFRFRVHFREGEQQDLFLVLRWRAQDRAELYLAGRPNAIQTVGDRIPRSDWPVQNFPYPSFRLQGNPGEEKEFLLRIESTSMMSFPMELMDEAGLRSDLAFETFLFSSSACLYILMIFAAVLYYKTTGLQEFVLYAGYILCMWLSYDVNFGNIYEFFDSGSSHWSEKKNYFFFGVTTILFFQFIRKFLETKRSMPCLNAVLRGCIFASLASLPMVFFDSYLHVLSKITAFLYAFAMPMILFAGIYLQRTGNRKLRLFLFSWTVYMLLGYTSIFYYLGFVGYTFFTVYALPILLPLDLIVLFYNVIRKSSRKLEEKKKSYLSPNPFDKKRKYTKSKLSGVDVDRSLESLLKLMDSEKPYLEENLQLQDVADRLGLNQHQLSELMNSRLGMNFASYVNSKRIEEVKRILESGTERNILNIAFTVGFGSKTSFNVEFKKATGLTPKQYKELFFRREKLSNKK
ncbi:helix-turn-helix domain-containing protein [Leptospira fluminis]|uniref:Helix-turn-helix domain-containing protein n=1 Tax=Leptospira fluminis TaxID=2484979 RepID=A0A4R9GTQ7_9LEPT|nr:helix-turn-helix domain-containing protein [Leptospira fluminis]